MNDLKSIISISRVSYPEDADLWVEIYSDVTMGISDYINMDKKEDPKNAYILISNVIHDWNFADIDGKKLSITEAGIKKLPASLAEWIISEATRLLVDDEDKKKA